MTSDPGAFDVWIAGLRKWHGWLQLSPERPYLHAEEEYNQYYGVNAPNPAEGEGCCNLLKSHGVDLTGPALEIGCGTGFLSFGFARHYPGPDYLITDPSPAFLRITHELFGPGFEGSSRRHFAILNADDLGLLPAGMFSVIALRSTLHHILNVEDFIAHCARSLRPGGALVMGAEPCETGYLLMASVAQSIPNALKAAGVEMRPAWTAKLEEFTSTVQFCCNRDVDKTNGEDKHFFNPHDLAQMGDAYGLKLVFLPTGSFQDFAPPYGNAFHCFSSFFLMYMQFCMRFDEEFMAQIRLHLQPQLKFIDDCYRAHAGPAISSIFLLRKHRETAD
ncbi:MAG: class I SAM-dependent methyltransferase [Opitutaceae bacterium]|nr:class I SAM-dependent methyltransferase [Opitutaceae bacterium]